MAHRMFCSSILLVCMLLSAPVPASAARPSEELLPTTTKVYVSIADLEKLTEAWNKTQLGELVNDPVMQPFVEDLQRQLKSKFSQAGVRLGVTFDDLQGIASGEVAVATLQPGDEAARAATALLADVTGRSDKAQALLEKVGKNLVEKGATAGKADIAGVSFAAYKLAKKKPTDRTITAYYGQHNDLLIAVDDLDTATFIVKHLAGDQADTLKTVAAFKHAMERSGEQLKTPAHIRWFLEPFGYVEVSRAYQGGRKKRGTDMLKVLSTQGFDAVQGLGGQIALATGDHEIRHQSFIYAPPVKEAGEDKYRLAARMLDFPNTDTLLPQSWIPKRLGTFLTFNWELKKAFWSSETLVNEIAGDDVFKDVMKSIETDPNGPRINVEQEFVRFLGKRATVISDYREPIDTKSERVLFAIEVTDPASVMATVNKAMKSDPDAKMITVDGHTIWEMTQEETFAVEEIKIDGSDTFGEFEGFAEDEEEDRFRPNAAVTVAQGHLLISTHVDYLVDLLKQTEEVQGVGQTADFQRVAAAMKQLGSNQDSFRLFSRTDHAYRVTYEMIRENKMPESESLLGKALNELFAPDEEDVLRENQVDGKKLPPFKAVEKYLGPAGMFIQTVDDGWTVSGALLRK